MKRAAKIRYIGKIQGSPVLPYVIDAYVSLRQAGNIEACDAPASGEEEAFYIENRLGNLAHSRGGWPGPAIVGWVSGS